ncbi:hypothetical protein OE88DRAFT_1286992 [Heliocybe sulcata]|uniref:Uncharacterized protein n=1 Tax=Heliocybe sulcata TaxID=5364 RepID=A0A5C3N9S8_9AGAM|nr:hypothetical protein OE88DRAFT_1286992 [Heliocybe sulcata]
MYIKSGNAVPSSERDMVILNATIAQVLAYRNFLLPPVLYSHPTFSLLNVNNWIHVDHFAAFLRVSRRHDPSSPLVCITSKALEAEELERKREREFLYPDFSLGGGIQPEQPAESNAKSLVPSGKYRSMSMTEFLNANMTAEELEQVSEDWLLGRD